MGKRLNAKPREVNWNILQPVDLAHNLCLLLVVYEKKAGPSKMTDEKSASKGDKEDFSFSFLNRSPYLLYLGISVPCHWTLQDQPSL